MVQNTAQPLNHTPRMVNPMLTTLPHRPRMIRTLALLLALTACAPSPTDTVRARDIRVIDGDTVRYDQESIRLMGFNTPETRGAECESERVMGYEAKQRLRDMIDAASVIVLDYKMRRDGDRTRDRYQRLLAILTVDGVDVGTVLIAEGLAEEYNGRGRRRDWCE